MNTPAEALRAHLDRLEMSTNELSLLIETNPRSVRRWVSGEQEPPRGVMLLLERLSPGEIDPLLDATEHG